MDEEDELQIGEETQREINPEVRAVSIKYPDNLVSFAIITLCFFEDLLSRDIPADIAIFTHISGVIGYSFAIPRIPSVPKSFLI